VAGPDRRLPEVVAAVNGQVEVLMDGGIRRGADIVKAICLGARAVLCGRAYAYGLAAAGEAGVARAIEILRTDLERTLRLLGCASMTSVTVDTRGPKGTRASRRMSEWCPQVPPERRTDRRSTDCCGVPQRLPDDKLHRCRKQPGHDGAVHACWCGQQWEPRPRAP